jgi:hypothetical protein
LALFLDVDQRIDNLKPDERTVDQRIRDLQRYDPERYLLMQELMYQRGELDVHPSIDVLKRYEELADLKTTSQGQKEVRGIGEWIVGTSITPLYGSPFGFVLCGLLGLVCASWGNAQRVTAPRSFAEAGIDGLIAGAGGLYLGVVASGLGKVTAAWLGGVPALAAAGVVWGLAIRWTIVQTIQRDTNSLPKDLARCVRCGRSAPLKVSASGSGSGPGSEATVPSATNQSEPVCRLCQRRQACRSFLLGIALATGALTLSGLFFTYVLLPTYAMPESSETRGETIGGRLQVVTRSPVVGLEILQIVVGVFFGFLVIGSVLAAAAAFTGIAAARPAPVMETHTKRLGTVSAKGELPQ